MADTEDPQIALRRPRMLVAAPATEPVSQGAEQRTATPSIVTPPAAIAPVGPQVIDHTRPTESKQYSTENTETINKMLQTLRSLASPIRARRVPVVRERSLR